MRFRVEPRDVPAHAAARRLGLTEAEFRAMLPALMRRGFPTADQTTGHFDLDAIDAWRQRRNPQLFGLTGGTPARDAKAVMAERMRGNG